MLAIIQKAIDAGFQCDPEESEAIAEIKIIHTENGDVWSFHTGVKIRPYPNKLSYGGYYGFGGTSKPEEKEEFIARIKQEFELYRHIGMTKIEIHDGQEITRVAQLKLM